MIGATAARAMAWPGLTQVQCTALEDGCNLQRLQSYGGRAQPQWNDVKCVIERSNLRGFPNSHICRAVMCHLSTGGDCNNMLEENLENAEELAVELGIARRGQISNMPSYD